MNLLTRAASRQKLALISLLATCLLFAAPSPAQNIPDPSFEQNTYVNGVGYASQNGGVITGWVISNPTAIGLNLNGTDNSGLFADNGAIPDGTNVAFIQSAGTTNSLSTTIAGLLPGATYRVTFRSNCRGNGYSAPGASWSLNGSAFASFTCFPPVGGSNPYYSNSATFIATSNTAPLAVQNYVSDGDGTLLLDDFTIQILPATLVHYRLNSTDAGTVAGGVVPSLGVLGNGTKGGEGVTLTNDIPVNGVPAGYGNNSIVCNGSGGILAPDKQQLTRTNISSAGGFTYEAWFKWTGGGRSNSIINYADTEKLVRRTNDLGPAMATDNSILTQIGAATSNQWHYAAVVFTPTNTVTAADSVSGYYTFYLDGNTPTISVSNITITSTGDSLNRTIGVGMQPTAVASGYFNGLIYEPRVSLGALPPQNLLFKPVFVVTSLADSGVGTLRQIVVDAPTNSVVNFASTLSGQTILLSTGQIELSNNIIIDASTLADGIQISGSGQSRVFQVDTNVTAVLNSLIITNGYDASGNSGGGILNNGTLSVSNCMFAGNISTNSSSGGGGINNGSSSFTANNSMFYNNSSMAGGAVGNGSGAAAFNNCTFYGNSAQLNGGAISTGNGTVTMNNCTISSNSALSSGGGIYVTGPAIMLTNSIVSGNTASSGSNISGTIAGGNNLIDGAPLLAAPGNYGGPTPTMPPLTGSPAIDTGTDSVTNFLTVDQRGYPRFAGAHVDIGAVEGYYFATGIGKLTNVTRLGNGSVQFQFTNFTDANLPVIAATNAATPLSNWNQIGFATESPAGSGKYQFTDPQSAAGLPQRYYRVRSP